MSKWSVPKATTATRLAGIPKKAEILCDKEEEAFYGGDGHTAGGKKFLMAHTKTTAFVYGVDRDAPLTAVATDSHRDFPGHALFQLSNGIVAPPLSHCQANGRKYPRAA